MSARSDILMWAQRVVGMKDAPAHQLLELPADCGSEDAQGAFHRIARMAHPDQHRTGLNAEELELVTQAYATIANAYQTLRNQTMSTQRMKPMKPSDVAGGGAVPVTPSGPAPVASSGQQMSSKALTYYRKAEQALRRGDMKGALLQIKMAIATDPQSAFLRTALAEVEIEMRKGAT